jgi:hypothetical protein
MAALDRWDLAASDIPQLSQLASRFHQDFDVEGLSVRDAIEVDILRLAPEARRALRGEALLVLERIPSEDEFVSFFIAAGAEHWVGDEGPRAVLQRWLAQDP